MKSLILLVLFGMVCTVLARYQKQECVPYTNFKEDCNDCFCTETGLKACTRMACPQPAPPQVCTPRSTYKQDCNTCSCNEDGTAATCTLKACLPASSCGPQHADGELSEPFK